MSIQLSIVVPVYKEEESIRPFLQRTVAAIQLLDVTYEIIFVLDPSPDNTEEIILSEINQNPHVKLIILSRRFGQAAAAMAGILACRGETCVLIDVDLQDPPELIPKLYQKLQEGYEVVYATRKSRKGETKARLCITATGYYLLNKFNDVPVPRNTGEFRIISRRVIEELRKLNETHGALRGLIAFVGFKQSFIEFDRDPRYTGKTKYNRLWGNLKASLNALFAFSSKPLQIITIMGFVLLVATLLLGTGGIVRLLFGLPFLGTLSPTHWVISFLLSIQLFSIGLLGEYIARIYEEVKRRPMVITDRKINFD